MNKRIHLGISEPGKKVKSIGELRIDLWTRQQAKQHFSQLIDLAYDQLENEGKPDEYYDELEASTKPA
jgi:hypothetical protein